MFTLSNKQYIKYTLSIAMFTLLLLLTSIYYLITHYDSNRIYDLRKVSKEYRVSLAEDYIDRRIDKNNSILFLGDSQPYGHLYPTEKIFPILLGKKLSKNILTLAFPDARILDNIYLLNYLKNKNISFNTIVFNINQAHIQENTFQHLGLKNKKDYKRNFYKDIKSFLLFALYPSPTKIPSEKIHQLKDKHYFDINNTTQNDYNIKLLDLISKSKDVTQNLIIYITPHNKNSIINNQKQDIELLKKISKTFSHICYINNVHYIEPKISEDKYYIDIVHFNTLGHKKMANFLVESKLF